MCCLVGKAKFCVDVVCEWLQLYRSWVTLWLLWVVLYAFRKVCLHFNKHVNKVFRPIRFRMVRVYVCVYIFRINYWCTKVTWLREVMRYLNTSSYWYWINYCQKLKFKIPKNSFKCTCDHTISTHTLATNVHYSFPPSAQHFRVINKRKHFIYAPNEMLVLEENRKWITVLPLNFRGYRHK